jgi:hypothetical protein
MPVLQLCQQARLKLKALDLLLAYSPTIEQFERDLALARDLLCKRDGGPTPLPQLAKQHILLHAQLTEGVVCERLFV